MYRRGPSRSAAQSAECKRGLGTDSIKYSKCLDIFEGYGNHWSRGVEYVCSRRYEHGGKNMRAWLYFSEYCLSNVFLSTQQLFLASFILGSLYILFTVKPGG